MKLRDKQTGEIWTLINRNEGTSAVLWVSNGSQTCVIESIEELASRFEDYEEPKNYWVVDYITCGVDNLAIDPKEPEMDDFNKQIGNYFETKEEAEKAVEKLKAWKRLKDKGFRFEGIKEDYTRILQSQEPFRTGKRYLQFNKSEDEKWMEENWEDLDLLFGGEK